MGGQPSCSPLPDSAAVLADESSLSGPLHKVQQGTQQTSTLQQAIELNQARALVCQASGSEAVNMYRKLEAAGMLARLSGADTTCTLMRVVGSTMHVHLTQHDMREAQLCL